jgi:hypothetical protein
MKNGLTIWTGPSIKWRTTVDQYIGLDVSLKDTSISVRQDGKRIWRSKCASDPKLLAEVIRKRAPHAKRAVFEIGPLSVWFYHVLIAEGLPAICIERCPKTPTWTAHPDRKAAGFDGSRRLEN